MLVTPLRQLSTSFIHRCLQPRRQYQPRNKKDALDARSSSPVHFWVRSFQKGLNSSVALIRLLHERPNVPYFLSILLKCDRLLSCLNEELSLFLKRKEQGILYRSFQHYFSVRDRGSVVPDWASNSAGVTRLSCYCFSFNFAAQWLYHTNATAGPCCRGLKTILPTLPCRLSAEKVRPYAQFQHHVSTGPRRLCAEEKQYTQPPASVHQIRKFCIQYDKKFKTCTCCCHVMCSSAVDLRK